LVEYITRLRFSATGSRVAATTLSGHVIVWSFQYRFSNWSAASTPVPASGSRSNGSHPSSPPRTRLMHVLPPFEFFAAHSRSAHDICFVKGGHEFVTAGDSSDGSNVCLWNVLHCPEYRLVHSWRCFDGSQWSRDDNAAEHIRAGGESGGGASGGATSVCYVAHTNMLIAGGYKGSISIIIVIIINM